MKTTKIYVVSSLNRLFLNNYCFFLSEEEAKYYCHLNKEHYLYVTELESGLVNMDKNFYKFCDDLKIKEKKEIEYKINKIKSENQENEQKINKLQEKLNNSI